MTLRVPLTSLGAWIFSMVVHASGLCVAVLLAAEFSVVPRIASFRWDVTLVAASRPEEFSSDKPIPASASSAEVVSAADDVPLHTTRSVGHRVPASSRSLIRQTAPATDGHMASGTYHQGSTQAVTPFEDSTGAPPSPTDPSRSEPSADNLTLSGMIQPVTNSTPAELPPPNVEASHGSNLPLEPTVPETPRLVSRPLPQFRPTPVSRHVQPDYSWLASVVATEVEQIKRYPAQAKWHRWQGNVVVQAVIHEDGRISDIQVVTSSGHDSLDHDAIALLERISPMPLQYSLDQPFIVVRIPIGYRLE